MLRDASNMSYFICVSIHLMCLKPGPELLTVICHQAYGCSLQAGRDRGPTSVSVASKISPE